MSRIFITGSADGLGRAAAQTLLARGHHVVVHARSPERLAAVQDLLDAGAQAVVGDLASLSETRSVAEQADRLGGFDAVVHNAGVYTGPQILPVNVVAPYVLTALITPPRRLIYLSSRMHLSGQAELQGLDWTGGRASASYADSKLFVTALAAAMARLWPVVVSSAVDPGWVPTKMGGPNAPDDLRLGHLTQEWLATSGDAEALVSGGYWHHQRRAAAHLAALDEGFQDQLLQQLQAATGVALPDGL